MIDLISHSVAETESLATRVGRALKGGEVIALDGELGAGKTCFVRGLVRGLGLDPAQVSSPTFIICQQYEPPETPKGEGSRDARQSQNPLPPAKGRVRGEGDDADSGSEPKGNPPSPRPSPGGRGSSEAATHTSGGEGLALIHIDAYRVSSNEELETIGWDELLARTDAVIAIEWAARIKDSLPEQRISIAFEHADETKRRLKVDAPVALSDRLADMIFRPAARDTTCPTCGGVTRADAPTYPFCSPRCRLADLGQWFRGSYQLSRPVTAEDEEV